MLAAAGGEAERVFAGDAREPVGGNGGFVGEPDDGFAAPRRRNRSGVHGQRPFVAPLYLPIPSGAVVADDVHIGMLLCFLIRG